MFEVILPILDMGMEAKKIMSRSSGFTLAEMMVTVAIISILGLGAASAFTFGATQFALLDDENETEANLLQSAFYLRLFAEQALKVQCAGGAALTALPPAVALVDTTHMSPLGVPDGLIDCRQTPVTWALGSTNALGIFFRENGVSSTQTTATSNYQGVGVYYVAPPIPSQSDGTAFSSGILIFSQQTGPSVATNAGAVALYHISNIQVQNFTTSPVTVPSGTYNMLQSITYQITARYFRAIGPKVYDPSFSCGGVGPQSPILCRDVTMQVNVGFHDNYLGQDLTGSQEGERLNGGMYFFKFMAPPGSSF